MGRTDGRKPDIERMSLRMESIWTEAEQRIMADVVRRIRENGKITSTADYQINRMIEMGKSREEIERILKEALGATWAEMFELYDRAAQQQYARNRDVYEQVNARFVPPEDNEWLKQTSEAVKQQTADELKNLSQSYGFSVMMGNRRVFMPFADYYQTYVDAAILDVLSGGMDYSSAIRRVVTQMTNSGLRFVDYASGRSNRADVAARRAALTGVSQITAQISERNAQELGTDYFEVDWHPAARPDHRAWQGKVYTKEELYSVCGLGTVTGLCGANCRHSYHPFIPGVSERMYTDEWLEEQNEREAQTKEWQGKELDAYGQTQQQRKMETAMRAQREKVQLLKEAGVDPDDIMLARAKYQGQLDEYSRYCKKMGLQEKRNRVYQDMRGRVAPGKGAYRKTEAPIRRKDSSRNIDILTDLSSSDIQKYVANVEKADKIKLDIPSEQFGKKVGKHAIEFGLDPSKEADRKKLIAIINDIYENPDEVRKGEWRGQGSQIPNSNNRKSGVVSYHIKGHDVVVSKDGEFITILKDGLIKSGRVANAKRVKMNE